MLGRLAQGKASAFQSTIMSLTQQADRTSFAQRHKKLATLTSQITAKNAINWKESKAQIFTLSLKERDIGLMTHYT